MKTIKIYDPEMSASEFMFQAKRSTDLRIGGKPWREVVKKHIECVVKSPSGWAVTIIYLGGNSYLME